MHSYTKILFSSNLSNTYFSSVDFLALGCSTIDDNFTRELLIIGIVKMRGPHTAENVLVAIKDILGQFKFNKAKISAIVCDEGSNLLRLFGTLNSENSFYLNFIEEDVDDPSDLDYEQLVTDETSDGSTDEEEDDDDADEVNTENSPSI